VSRRRDDLPIGPREPREPRDPRDPIDPRPPRDPVPPRDPRPPNDPPQPEAVPGANPSITSWTRLDVRCREAEMRASLSARVFDPLWFLTRQWQMGEFQGEDTGTPVMSRVRAETTVLSRCYLGELALDTQVQAPLYDVRAMPLEAMVERRPVRPASVDEMRMLHLAVEAGLHFLKMLEQEPLSKNYRAAISTRYALQPPDAAELANADVDTVRFIQTMADRAADGRALANAIRTDGAANFALDTALKIASGDRAEVAATAQRWLAWYDTVLTEPQDETSDAWMAPRMEYAMTVAARLSADPFDERSLTASEFYDGHLDWSSFDLNFHINTGTLEDRKFKNIVETTIPAPVTFRGAPAARYWEMEDSRIDYGLSGVGPTDLAQMLMIEYASSYGNDWFVAPFELEVGSLTRVSSLVITDSFGVQTLVRPIGDRALPKPHWSMFQLAHFRKPGEEAASSPERNLFFLPPVLGRSLSSPAVEDVLFMRDEMANIAWAIERSIQSPLEQPLALTDTTQKQDSAADTGVPPASVDALPRYQLATTVPYNWIPLLPVQIEHIGPPQMVLQRLKRGAMLQPDGTNKIHRAQGRILDFGDDTLLYDEEIPREGIHVTQHYQFARWIDGSTWTWLSNLKAIGRGGGSSGLRFDSVEEPTVPPSE
jgi:hypothetical protein